jgi:RNA polymerase sigma-70 factor (ECF subfamily)
MAGEAIPLTKAAESGMEALVRENLRLVYQISFAVLRSRHDAEDATQETFLRAMKYGSNLSRIREPRSWLAKVAWRVAVAQRKKSQELPLEDSSNFQLELAAPGRSADDLLADAQGMEMLEQQIARLPDELREAITLCSVEELPATEVAQILGVSDSVVRSRVFRAKQILRARLLARTRENESF